MAKSKKRNRQSLKSQPLATKAGPAGWIMDAEPNNQNMARQQALEAEIGAQLIDISRWVGLRASYGDRRSIDILEQHLNTIFGCVQKSMRV